VRSVALKGGRRARAPGEGEENLPPSMVQAAFRRAVLRLKETVQVRLLEGRLAQVRRAVLLLGVFLRGLLRALLRAVVVLRVLLRRLVLLVLLQVRLALGRRALAVRLAAGLRVLRVLAPDDLRVVVRLAREGDHRADLRPEVVRLALRTPVRRPVLRLLELLVLIESTPECAGGQRPRRAVVPARQRLQRRPSPRDAAPCGVIPRTLLGSAHQARQISQMRPDEEKISRGGLGMRGRRAEGGGRPIAAERASEP
jgi:hypothetical protein